MTFRVAVVATACEFPDGRTPEELWSTVLDARRCFRRIPGERLALAEYAADEADPDGIYPIEAALLEGYQFDRERFRIPQSCFERSDLAHWLALDVATRALSTLTGIESERDAMSVIVANTLTGEFSRAHAMRYRWPYVKRAIQSAASELMPDLDLAQLIDGIEARFKSPFPAPDEDSLAGALSNTIAGRISNYHNLRGGAHVVDGACASSLVAVTSAYERMAAGGAECVLVGAVDLSLDPFELVGFARNGALARKLMRVFDQESDGFWPGEGCGFVVLATEDVVMRRGWPVLAWIRGAAMSTDGAGALTRPTVDGQILAARRAWACAGRDPANADYFEAHGTGTPTGDPIELAGLAGLLGSSVPRAAIPVGSIKANIGHTKAAAGMAGLLKAISICQERIIPATSGCVHAHAILQSEVGSRIEIRAQASPVLHRQPISVGVNSFGFGGVNCHVVLEGAAPLIEDRPSLLPTQVAEAMSDELFQLAAPSAGELAALLEQLERRADSLSRAQVADLAYALVPDDSAAWRACVTARTPQELGLAAGDAARELRAMTKKTRRLGRQFSWSAPAATAPRIGLLFPGQGSALQLRPLAWATRFCFLQESASKADALMRQDRSDTAVLQPLLAEIAIAGLELLRNVEIDAEAMLGHSFGELPALFASGQLPRHQLRELSSQRGACMREHAAKGGMLAVRATHDVACELAAVHDLDVACENGAMLFVLAGDAGRISAAAASCAMRKIGANTLSTAHAFHSRGMGKARAAFARHADEIAWQPAQRKMVSSITGRWMDGSEPVGQLLARQLTDTVKFTDALAHLGDFDLLLEVGTGTILAALAEEHFPGRAMSLDIFGDSPAMLLAGLGSAWVCGAPLNRAVLYQGRRMRPCKLDEQPLFLHNPCGLRPGEAHARPEPHPEIDTSCVDAMPDEPVPPMAGSALDALRFSVAELTGLSIVGLDAQLRLLSDLHLNSIRARHAVALAAQSLGIEKMPFELARFANASLAEAAAYLEDLRHAAPGQGAAIPEGIAPWLRFFTHHWIDVPLAPHLSAIGKPIAYLDDALGALPLDCRALLTLDELPQARCLVLVLTARGVGKAPAALLRAVQGLLAHPDPAGLLVLQESQLANAFLRSAAAELPQLRLCVVEYEALDCDTMRTAIAQYAREERGYSELRLRAGQSQCRALAVVTSSPQCRPWRPRPGSVLLVTGGARGIGAASAAALAHQYGYRLALVGRSAPDHEDIVNTLAGLHAAGHQACYVRSDLSDKAQARAALEEIASGMGQISAVLHAAGVNRPVAIRELDPGLLQQTLASKLTSFDNVLACLPADQLELVVGFGSIIGELGLAGEAHYALANEWLARALRQLASDAPGCRVVHLAWSAWRETGMAVRMDGVLDGLRRAGTRALDTPEAVEALLCAIDAGMPSSVISGRYGRVLDADSDMRMLQKHRYLERPLVFYPGVELIAEAVLSSDTDRYLRDHAPFGVPLFPLACAIEAMLGAALCLHPDPGMPVIGALRVGEGIVFAAGQPLAMRTSALVLEDGSIHAEIRTAATGYEVMHFSATFRWCQLAPAASALPASGRDSFPAAALLYGGLCFHGPRFQRLAVVSQLSATHCQVRTGRGPSGDWYGSLLPQSFAGGGPAVRDAVLHALQLCVPHQVVLPVAAAEVCLGVLDPDAEYLISACQTFSDGTRFVFDIDVSDAAGVVVECWRGLEFVRASAAAAGARIPMAPALLESFIGRVLHDQLDAPLVQVGVVVGPSRGQATALALARAVGSTAGHEAMRTSATHADDITVALAGGPAPLAVDLQFAPSYNIEEWRLMLGEPRMHFARALGEAHQIALPLAILYTWVMSECLIKLGIDGWPLAQASASRVDTAFVGAMLQFECAQCRLLVLALDLAGGTEQAALAVALAPCPPALAPEQESTLVLGDVQ